MIDERTRIAFERMTLQGAGEPGPLTAGLRREVTKVGLRALAAKLLNVAAVRPTRLLDVYDGAAAGWTGGPLTELARREAPVGEPSDAFWTAMWGMLDTPVASRDATDFTVLTARLAGLLNPDLDRLAAQSALMFPGVEAAATAAAPLRIDSERLAQHPPTTLGGSVHRERVIRGRPSDVLDPARLDLDRLPAPLAYLNGHILKCHLIWAAVAGYGAAPLDEIAFAAFKMGQFGHHYSSLVIGLTVATLAFERPAGLEIVLECIFRGWLHGRATPPLVGIAWEDYWDLPVESVRERLGVAPFDSPLAAFRRLADGPGQLH